MESKIKEQLIEAAKANTGVAGTYRLAAGIVYKSRLLTIGVNSYKTHPIMMNKGYKEEQIYLHAEADAIVKVARYWKSIDLKDCKLYVVRMKKTPKGKWIEALAKPCEGCMGLISSFGIGEIEWTT